MFGVMKNQVGISEHFVVWETIFWTKTAEEEKMLLPKAVL